MEKTRDLYLEAAMLPDYIKNETMAKEVIKTVLGVLVSKLSEEDAQNFVDDLPEYLTMKNLRGHQEKITPATPEDCVSILQEKLKISEEQAQELMLKIISVTKKENKDKPGDISKRLTGEWRNVFHEV